MFSPFKNGIRRRHDDSTMRQAGSERDDERVAPKEMAALAPSPTLQEDRFHQGQNGYAEASMPGTDSLEIGDNVYSPPSILDEDEDDPHSHAAMTRRAEEILANAKKRLTVSSR